MRELEGNRLRVQKQLNSRKLSWLVAENKESTGSETIEQQEARLAREQNKKGSTEFKVITD